MDHLSTVKSKEGHGPSLLGAVETDTRSARIVWCSCFRLRGRKHGYGENTALEKPADEANGLCEKTISRNGKRKWEKEILNFSLEIYFNVTWEVVEWEVGEQGIS